MPERRGRRDRSVRPEIKGAPTRGQLIKQSREAQGLTQRDFKDVLSPSYLSRIERDQFADPAPEILEGIAERLGMRVEDLGGQPSPERFMARHTADVVIGALRSQFLPEIRALGKQVEELIAEVRALRESKNP